MNANDLVFGNYATSDGPWASVEDCAGDLMDDDDTLTEDEAITMATVMSASRRKVPRSEYDRRRQLFLNAGRGWQN